MKTEHLPVNRTPDLLKYAEEMRKLGRKEETIRDNTQRFQRIAKICNDINDPEQFKTALSQIKWSNSTKSTTASSYTFYLKLLGKTWTPPRYIIQEKIYFIPTEQELDQLISAAGRTIAPLLQLLKETGMRIGEAYNIEWKDIDQEHKTVSVNHPEKGSLPRILRISDKLKGMLNNIPKDTDAPFSRTSTKKGLMITFQEMRERTAKKLNNPRLKQIHFHTFRHWKATTDYYKLRDGTIIRHILGHRTATMTDRYIHIVETLYHDENGEWTSKAIRTKEEAMQLLNDGWTKADEIDGFHIYRKRK